MADLHDTPLAHYPPAVAVEEEEFVAWRWECEGSPLERWSLLHRLDPNKPGMTRCGTLARPVQGTSDHGHVFGATAIVATAATGRCTRVRAGDVPGCWSKGAERDDGYRDLARMVLKTQLSLLGSAGKA
jgi:hypothetical protein